MMKKNLKRIAAMAMAASIMAGAMGTTTAFAASKSVSAGGYGTLTGTLSGTKTTGTAKTSVTKNPDNANLTLAVDLKKAAGGNVVATKNKSKRGVKSITLNWETNLPGIACAYGGHGVQGGSQYKAYAVYTYTDLK